MAKKIDEAEVKKECPSCGLGVALDSTICEFCGWDFEEEDEWILQIEKLERELMLEKQKFEPGSVEGRIQSTLHTPAVERIEMRKAAAAKASEEPKPAAKAPPPARAPDVVREVRPSEPKPPPIRAPVEAPRPAPRAVEAAPKVEAAAPKVRRVRTMKSSSAPAQEQEASDDAQKKSKLVRKVKQ